jgi:hypothetical protein
MRFAHHRRVGAVVASAKPALEYATGAAMQFDQKINFLE